MYVHCLSVHVARRSTKREIARVWEPGALGAEELMRFRPAGAPPPVVGVGVRSLRYILPELPPPSRGMDVARTKMVVWI